MTATATKQKKNTKTLPCPSCGQPEGVELCFGFPNEEAWEESQRGEIILGDVSSSLPQVGRHRIRSAGPVDISGCLRLVSRRRQRR